MLDCDNGTYPFVTSSHPAAGGASYRRRHRATRSAEYLRCGESIQHPRVGEGPFPTEQVNEIGDRIRNIAHEFGTVTTAVPACRLATPVPSVTRRR